jgi:hypothetical protein
MTLETIKAPAQLCRYCGDEMPAQPSTPGRPRQFCTRRCGRAWHILKERFERAHAAEEKREQNEYEQDWRWYGKRAADKARREARKRYAERERMRQQILQAPWKEKEKTNGRS